MSKETEKAGRYRLFAAKLRVIAAADVAEENRDLLHQVVDDFEQMAGDLEAFDQLGVLKEESPEPVAASWAGYDPALRK